MIRNFILLAIVAVGGWYYFDSQSKMSESHVLDHIKASMDSSRRMDATTSCDLVADDVEIVMTTVLTANSTRKRYDKASYCDYVKDGFSEISKLPSVESLPSMNVSNVMLSEDKKRATMNFSQTEKLIVNGRTIATTNGTGTMELVMVKRNALLRAMKIEVR